MSHSSGWKPANPSGHQSSHSVLFPDPGSFCPAAHGGESQSPLLALPQREENLFRSQVQWMAATVWFCLFGSAANGPPRGLRHVHRPQQYACSGISGSPHRLAVRRGDFRRGPKPRRPVGVLECASVGKLISASRQPHSSHRLRCGPAPEDTLRHGIQFRHPARDHLEFNGDGKLRWFREPAFVYSTDV